MNRKQNITALKLAKFPQIQFLYLKYARYYFLASGHLYQWDNYSKQLWNVEWQQMVQIPTSIPAAFSVWNKEWWCTLVIMITRKSEVGRPGIKRAAGAISQHPRKKKISRTLSEPISSVLCCYKSDENKLTKNLIPTISVTWSSMIVTYWKCILLTMSSMHYCC